jgi:tetratricopeptide (TPR) repeat protein
MLRLRSLAGSAALAALCASTLPARAANPLSADDLAARSRAECETGRRAVERTQRKAHFDTGQALAEQAVRMDEKNAEAHFALFCNLGELMRLDGETLSSVLSLRRLIAEVDRTLELDPGHIDAMAAKGTLLVRLPRLLGGDAEKGEAMLRQVIEQDPKAVSSRLALAKTCEARGDRDEALAFATRALQIAREQGRADRIAEAQATLAELSR